MPLSKEFYLEEIKSKYPNSYNESLKDLPVKDLEDMLDFLESALDKANGGPVGIEILFSEKVPAAPSQLVSESDIILGYRGDAAYRSGSAQASSIGQGNVGSKASFGGGKGRDRSGRDEGASGAQVSQALESQRLQNIANQNKSNATVDTLKNVYGIVSPFINPGSTLGKVKSVFDAYNIYKNSPINEKDLILGMEDQPLPSDNLLAFEPGSKKDKQLKSLFKEKGLTEDLGIPFPAKKEKKLQELMKEDQEQTDFPKTELLKAKDGGRVGLFMGGPALEGQALAIYNSMNEYGFSDQEIANALQERGLYTPGGSTPDAPDEGIIGAQLNQGGGRDDDKRTGFGKFGNLDPTTKKTFVKDVYTIDAGAPGAPMTGSFKPTEVIGYKNVNTGIYQTLEGKNINHAGIPIKPGIAAILEGIGLGGIDETKLTGLPYPEGYIAGTFTGKKLSDFNPFNLFKKQQATVAEINAMNQKAIKDMQAKKAAEEAAARRELENRIISGGANISGSGDDGRGNITTSAGTFAPGDYSDVAGTLADPREKMDYYRDGGLATMFRNKR